VRDKIALERFDQLDSTGISWIWVCTHGTYRSGTKHPAGGRWNTHGDGAHWRISGA
jgi:hypothetical protein